MHFSSQILGVLDNGKVDQCVFENMQQNND